MTYEVHKEIQMNNIRDILNPSAEAFNWLKALNFLVKNPEPTIEEIDAIREAAAYWPTCACGELCKKLPRRADKAPEDDELRELGICFLEYIDNEMWAESKEIFLKIEKRTQLLLTQHDSNPPSVS